MRFFNQNLSGFACSGFDSPPSIGGVRGGNKEAEIKGDLLIYKICSTPPRLPYSRGGIKCLLIYFLLLITFFVCYPTHAAEFLLRSSGSEKFNFGMEQEFSVDLSFDTDNAENINAMEGTLFYPRKILELKEIRDGNSIINFWIERPKAEQNGQIHFSGITPGGYQGKNGFVLSAIFQTVAIGSGSIDIRELSVLQNDGKGTSVPVTAIPFQFVVSREGGSEQPILKKEKDADPPEAFTLEIARDPNLFENRWFVVFASQDKGSGIDYYEVLENRSQNIENRSWIQEKSPYVLQDQELKSFIYVRAVDKAGNERIAVLSPRSSPQYAGYVVWSILGVVIVASYFFVRILWKKQKRKK